MLSKILNRFSFKKLTKRDGFTLLEIVVVMAVIAVLVMMAVPNFLGRSRGGYPYKSPL